MKDAIKETGEYTVNVKLHREVVLQIPVTVIAEGGEIEAKEDRKAKKHAKKVSEKSDIETEEPDNELLAMEN